MLETSGQSDIIRDTMLLICSLDPFIIRPKKESTIESRENFAHPRNRIVFGVNSGFQLKRSVSHISSVPINLLASVSYTQEAIEAGNWKDRPSRFILFGIG